MQVWKFYNFKLGTVVNSRLSEGRRKYLTFLNLRDSSFNMTRGDGDIEGGVGGAPKIFATRKGALKKWRGLRKFVYFKTNRNASSKN